ncbi:MAG: magnesium transporter [Rhodospirillales bacterium]
MAKSSEAALHWARIGKAGGDKPEAEAQREETLKRVRALIKAEQRKELTALLKPWDPIDLIDLLTALRLKHARKLYFWLPEGPSAKVLAELRPEYREVLFRDETLGRLTAIFERLPAEEAAAALDRLPDSLAETLVAGLRQREALAAQRQFGPDTAGRVMTRKLMALPPETSVTEAIAAIRANAERLGDLATLYVVDAERRLVGRLKVNALLFLPEAQTLEEAMERDPVAVSPATDQEKALRLALKRNLPSLPVVDEAGHLVGRITVKQLRRIMQDEAEEDMMLMSGVSPDADSQDSVTRIVRGRLPWLLAGLIGATIAALVVGSFEDELAKAAILAAFIPVCMSMAGNSGLQASAVAVQGLARGTLWAGDTLWRLTKELLGAMINGATAGTIVAGLVFLASTVVPIEAPHRLALSVFFSLIAVTTIAAVVGASVPVLLEKIGIDPAMATGVFITTSNDVLGVLVFFLMATAFYF